MKERMITLMILTITLFVLFLRMPNGFYDSNTIPSLPQPIAEETVLITSAGQSIDTYIVKDLANELLIHNYFMPLATHNDLSKTNSVIIVFGYSDVIAHYQKLSITSEINRLNALILSAQKENKPIIGIFIGDKQRRDKQTDQLLTTLVSDLNYLIATESGNFDGFLYKITEESHVPLTIIDKVDSLSEPLVSIFR